MIKTITLTGAEQEVTFDGNNTYCWVQNLGSADLLVSLSSGIVDGADNVLTIPSGGAGYVRDDTSVKKLYILGTGKAQVYGTNNAFCPFKTASGGGDGGGEATSYKILTGTVTPGPQDTQITFAEAFNTVPIVIGTMYNSSSNSNGRAETCHTTAINTTGCTFETRYILESSSKTTVAGTSSGALHWVAIGT